MLLSLSLVVAGAAASPPPAAPSRTGGDGLPRVTVACALDDKEATPSPTTRSAWRAEVLAGHQQPRDLTRQGGGGPLGAEWNTACDLLVRLEAPPHSEPPVLVLPDGPPLPLASSPDHPGIWWVWLERDRWHALRRDPTDADAAWRGSPIPADLRTAVQVVDLPIRHGPTTTVARLLWAGGE